MLCVFTYCFLSVSLLTQPKYTAYLQNPDASQCYNFTIFFTQLIFYLFLEARVHTCF